MKTVVSVRLNEDTVARLRARAKQENKELSTVARELIDQGWVFTALREYRNGVLSLSNMADRLDLSVSDAIALLSELGVRSPVEYDDYLASYRDASILAADREE